MKQSLVASIVPLSHPLSPTSPADLTSILGHIPQGVGRAQGPRLLKKPIPESELKNVFDTTTKGLNNLKQFKDAVIGSCDMGESGHQFTMHCLGLSCNNIGDVVKVDDHWFRMNFSAKEKRCHCRFSEVGAL